MMSNKKNNDEDPKYIIDRITRRSKKSEPEPQKRKRQPMKRTVDDSSTLGLGCWFFLILPFIATILMLIILIGLSQ